MRDSPLVARFLPWRAPEPDQHSPVYQTAPGDPGSVSAVTLPTAAVSASSSVVTLPTPPSVDTAAGDSAPLLAAAVYRPPAAMNTSSQLTLATSSVKLLNGVVRPAQLGTAAPPVAAAAPGPIAPAPRAAAAAAATASTASTSPAAASTSPTTGSTSPTGPPALRPVGPVASVASPVSPEAASPAARLPPAFPLPPTPTQPPVELPGSILMDNGGFPGARVLPKRIVRDHEGEKFASTVLKTLTKDPAPAVPPRRDRARPAEPAAPAAPSAVPNRCELEAVSLTALPSLRAVAAASPRSPRRHVGDAPREKVIVRKGRVAADSQSEIERVSKVLARRLQSLELDLKERDGKISTFEQQLKKQRASHDARVRILESRHAQELGSLKSVLSLLEAHYTPPASPTKNDAHIRPISPLRTPTRPDTGGPDAKPKDADGAGDVKAPSVAASVLAPKGADIIGAGVQTADALEDLERKVENAVRCVQKLREQGEKSRAREEELTRLLQESRRPQQPDLDGRVEALEREKTALRETLTGRDEHLHTLEEELTCWRDDVDKLEGTVQKYMEAQRDMDHHDSRQGDLERQCSSLRDELAERDATVRQLQLEMDRRAKMQGAVELPLSPESISDATLQAMKSPTDDKTGAGAPAEDAQTRAERLEAKVQAQAEDIRLYKLDVKGYKKDVRGRDTKIRELQDCVIDLQRKLADRPSSGAQVEVPLGIDLGGPAFSPHSRGAPSAQSMPSDVQPRSDTPPMTPTAKNASLARPPVSKYNTTFEAQDAPALAPSTPSPRRPNVRKETRSPSPLMTPPPPTAREVRSPSPLMTPPPMLRDAICHSPLMMTPPPMLRDPGCHSPRTAPPPQYAARREMRSPSPLRKDVRPMPPSPLQAGARREVRSPSPMAASPQIPRKKLRSPSPMGPPRSGREDLIPSPLSLHRRESDRLELHGAIQT